MFGASVSGFAYAETSASCSTNPNLPQKLWDTCAFSRQESKKITKITFFAKKIKNCLDSEVGFVYTALTATQHAVPEKEKAPVAQLDRASDYGSEGLRFESSRACFSQGMNKMPVRFNETGFFVHSSLGDEHGGVPVSTEHSRRRLHVEVDRLASLKAAQKIKCLF